MSSPWEPPGLRAAPYKVQFTASRELVDKLKQAQALLSHRIPDGDLTQVLAQALTLLNECLLKKRFALRSVEDTDNCGQAETTTVPAASTPPAASIAPAASTPPAASPPVASTTSSGRSRHIPNAIKREVAGRDGLRCAFVDADGHRCEETRFLEFHHRHPWARHHRHRADEIELRCRAHNQQAARVDYGAAHVEDRIRARKTTS